MSYVVVRRNAYTGQWYVKSSRIFASRWRAGWWLDKSRERVVEWKGSQASTLEHFFEKYRGKPVEWLP